MSILIASKLLARPLRTGVFHDVKNFSRFQNHFSCAQYHLKILSPPSPLGNQFTLKNEVALASCCYDFVPKRGLHISSVVFDKSKVEDSLKQIKHEKITDVSSAEKEIEKPEEKLSLRVRFVNEVKHYYHGFRLLVLDVKLASGTVWKYLNALPVMRREQRQFTRAVSDIFRLMPFSVFILIPLAELLLPIALKLFPNMLPSTFESGSTKKKRLQKELAVKLEMSKFLQDTMEDMAIRAKRSANKQEAAKDLLSFIEKTRNGDGPGPTNEDIMKHAKFFENEITLKSLTRDQLMALCKLLQIPAVGHNAALRLMLDLKLSSLASDDKMIQSEGISSLTTEELVAACQERGMRALGVSRPRLETQLSEWIDLHLNSNVSSSLLLLSRILYLPENVRMEYRVKEAISSLSDKAAEEAQVRASEINLERVDNKTLYKTAKQEQEDIAVDISNNVNERTKPSKTDMPTDTITQADIDMLVDLILKATQNRATLSETKSELKELQEDMTEYQTDVKNLNTELAADHDNIIKKDTKASSRIQKRLNKLVNRMENIVEDLEQQGDEGSSVQVKKLATISFNDIISSVSDVQNLPVNKLLALFETLDTDKDGKIDLAEAKAVISALNSEDIQITPGQLALLVAMFSKQAEMNKDSSSP